MKFLKIARAQEILRKLAGYKLPIAIGAAAVGGAHVIGRGLKKGHEYKAGFTPGNIPQEH